MLNDKPSIEMVKYKGFTISQSKVNHHVMIYSDEHMVMHVSANEPLTYKELINLVDFYLDFAGGENHGRTM